MRTLALVLAGAASDLLQADDPGAVPGSSAERLNEKKAFKRDDARGLLPRWREHLAILAANASLAPEESRRVMAALGDALVASSRESFHETKDSDLFNAHAAFALAGVAPEVRSPRSRIAAAEDARERGDLPRGAHAEIEDPFGQSIDMNRRTAELLNQLTDELVQVLAPVASITAEP